MTNEQINWAITEAIGADPHWKCAKDYCSDLNAMHEAEKTLAPKNWNNFSENWWNYYKHLQTGEASRAITCRGILAHARQMGGAAMSTWREKYMRDPELADSIINALRDDLKESEKRAEMLAFALEAHPRPRQNHLGGAHG
jgi:hypothetical protein